MILTVSMGYWGCGSKVMASVDQHIDGRAKTVVDTEISRQLRPIEQLLYKQTVLQLKTNDYLESSFTPAEMAKARAVWIRDSLTVVHQLEAFGFSSKK